MFHEQRANVESAVKNFEGMGGAFFLNVYHWVNGAILVHHPDIMVFEAPILNRRKLNIASTRKLQGMTAIVEMLAFQHKIRCFEVEPRTIKKHATGDGNASKAMMVEMARTVGWKPATDDEADALWLHDYASQILIHAEKRANA